MVKCPGCGGSVFFDPSRQAVVCRQCGLEYKEKQIDSLQDILIGEVDSRIDSAEITSEHSSGKKSDQYQTLIYTCPNCGGQLISGDETVGTFCSFCGSNVLLESRLSNEKKPDRLIPFQITKEQAEENYRKTLRKALYTPSYMNSKTHMEEFRGIYMPYWIYSCSTPEEAFLRVNSKKMHTSGNYEITDHYESVSKITASQSGMSYDAVSGFSDALSEGIAPFNEKQSRSFHPAYLSGFYADLADVDAGNYSDQAAEETKAFVAKEASADPAYQKAGASLEDVEKGVYVKQDSVKMGMYPVWFLASRTGKKRISYAVVNGQTGKVAADLPISFWKYLLGSLILAIPLFLLFNLFLSLNTTAIIIAAAFFSLLSLFLLNKEINSAYTSETQWDDLGFLSVNPVKQTKELQEWLKKVKDNRKKEASRISSTGLSGLLVCIGAYTATFGTGILIAAVVAYCLLDYSFSFILLLALGVYAIGLIIFLVVDSDGFLGSDKQIRTVLSAPMSKKYSLLKPLAGLIVCVGCYFLKPVQDQYYYGCAIFAMVMTIWAIFDLVVQHNLQTTRKLPQFNKRGGSQILSMLLALILLSSVLTVPVNAASNSASSDSNYQLVIQDDEDLLTSDEEKMLTDCMTSILEYGNCVFVTVSQTRENTSEYASRVYKSLFGSASGTLFIIDMGQRKIYIFSDGLIYQSVTNYKAETITDNVYRYATDRQYYLCAKEAYSQILLVLEGQSIAEPMRYTCNALLAVLCALLINFLIVSVNSRLKAPTDEERNQNYLRSFRSSKVESRITHTTRKYVPPSSGGGGGGSSGGGGGSSGGGGGHSF